MRYVLYEQPLPYYEVPQFVTISELLELTKTNTAKRSSSIPKRKKATKPYRTTVSMI